MEAQPDSRASNWRGIGWLAASAILWLAVISGASAAHRVLAAVGRDLAFFVVFMMVVIAMAVTGIIRAHQVQEQQPSTTVVLVAGYLLVGFYLLMLSSAFI